MQEQQTGRPVRRTKKQWAMFLAGLIAFCTGVSVLGFFGIRKLCRTVKKHKLMNENAVIEIPDLRIKAPVLEGTDNDVLRQAAGHFPGTGDFGTGNYCIAAHSSTLYKEYFNNLKSVETGMRINLYDKDKTCYAYTVSGTMIVAPSDTWVLDATEDSRITLITCTDDGSQRLVVTGLLLEPTE